MRVYSVKGLKIERRWHLIDASGKVLGKIATEAARLLMGKNKPIFTRNLDTGDYVVITNSVKVKLTGKKLKEKTYFRHSNYPGGLKSITAERMLQTNPNRLIEKAVKGMLPQNRLGAAMLKKLKVYAGEAPPDLIPTKDKQSDKPQAAEKKAEAKPRPPKEAEAKKGEKS